MRDRPYSPEYYQWRKKVLKRDGERCKICGKNNDLQAHHIKAYKDNEELRYEVSNGIILCFDCHQQVNGKEEEYEWVFAAMLRRAANTDVLKLLYG